MATQQQTINGLPLPQVDPAQVESAVRAMAAQAAQTATDSLGTFANVQQRRAARMANVATALSQQVGKKDPAVLAIQNAADQIVQLKTQVASETARLKKWPKPRPNEWLVFGHVMDAKGSPIDGITVRVFDRDRKYDDLLGDTSTDENGDFSIIYHERDFKETGENLPDLYVMVIDASGKVVYSSRDSVRYEAGRSEYFAIRLGAKRPQTPRKKGPSGTGAAPQKTVPSRPAKTGRRKT